jgi:hypothetical protein
MKVNGPFKELQPFKFGFEINGDKNKTLELCKSMWCFAVT